MGERVHVGFGEQDWVLFGGGFEQLVGVLPEQLHVVPVLDYAVVYGVAHLEQASSLAVEGLAHHDIRLA